MIIPVGHQCKISKFKYHTTQLTNHVMNEIRQHCFLEELLLSSLPWSSLSSSSYYSSSSLCYHHHHHHHHHHRYHLQNAIEHKNNPKIKPINHHYTKTIELFAYLNFKKRVYLKINTIISTKQWIFN